MADRRKSSTLAVPVISVEDSNTTWKLASFGELDGLITLVYVFV
jgi:hypothetical protein